MGYEGFTWALGKVEDLEDPKKLGRVKVRVFSEHDDLTVDDLLWCHPLLPVTSAALTGVGQSPTGLLVGSYVMLFYMDGKEKQKPIILGSIPKIPDNNEEMHDVSKLARGIGPESNQLGPEPKRAYEAKYPYNKVTQTQSGHIVELDDTPDHERINIEHKSGSYIEINSEGRKVNKIVGDSYEIIQGDETIYVKGKVDIQLLDNCDLSISNDLNVTASSITINSDVTIENDLTVNGNATFNGDVTIQGRRPVLT